MTQPVVCFISKNIYLFAANSGRAFAGGAEFQLLTLAQHLKKAGNKIIFVTGDFGQKPREVIDEIEFSKVPFRYLGKGKIWLVPDWLQLLRELRKINADFYLFKGPRFQLAILSLFSRIFRKNVVFISSIDTDSRPDLLNQIDPFYQRILYKFGLKFIPLVVCQSASQQQNFKTFFNKDGVVIKNIYHPQPATELKKQNFVLWVGTNNQLKRPWLLIEFARQVPEIHIKMAMIPATDPEQQRKFETAVQQVPNIEFMGFVPETGMAKLYAEAALLLNFSKLEGFPNVFLHAWSHKTPVITLEIDPDDVIKKYQLGFCTSDLEKMVQVVQSLLRNPSQLAELGGNGFRYVRQEHAPEVIVAKYQNLFAGNTHHKPGKSRFQC
jgi:glycosyltransferase involved in cell wall biosynthesis